MAIANLNYALPMQGFAAGGSLLGGLGADPKQAQQQLGQNYNAMHNAALEGQTRQREGIQTGYANLRSEADQIYNNIFTNMNARYGDVLGRIAGTNTSNINDIGRNAQAQSGAASQQMVSRGLGNTTVQQNMQRAIEADRARETTRSNEAFANLEAGYADRIWGDRTQAQQAKAAMMAGLGTQQLGAMERVNIAYPDANAYMGLAQMYGANAQAQENRKAMQGGIGGMRQQSLASGGYSSSPSPFGSKFFGGGGDWTDSGGGSYGWGSSGGGGGGSWASPSAQQISDSQRFYDQAYGAGSGTGYSDLGTDYYQPNYGAPQGMDEVPMDNYGGDAYA